MTERLLDPTMPEMTFKEGRLYLRSLDLKHLAKKPRPDVTDMNMIINFSKDIVRDAEVVLTNNRVLHPNVEANIGLLKTIVFLADAAGW